MDRANSAYLIAKKFSTVSKLRTFLIFATLLAGVIFAGEYAYRLSQPAEVAQPVAAPEAAQDQAASEEDESEPEEQGVASSAPAVVSHDDLPHAKPVRRRGPNTSVEPSKVQLRTIREIEFSGVTAFPVKELQKLVKEFIGQELTVQEAFDIPAKISQHYSAHNLVARANLVGSLERDGVLRVSVIETQMKQEQVEQVLSTLTPAKPVAASAAVHAAMAAIEAAAPASSTTAAVAAAPVSAPAAPASMVTPVTPTDAAPVPAASVAAPAPAPASGPVSAPAPQPERAVAVAKTPAPVPTGDQETDYILQRYANKTRQYEVIVDNFGIESTGSNRVGASMRAPDALMHEDEVYVMAVKSSGSQNVGLGYRLKTGIEGLGVGVKLSKLTYDVVSGVQSALYVSGDAMKKGVELVYDLVKAPDHVSSVALSLDNKDFHNAASNPVYSNDYMTRVTSLQWKGVMRELEPGGAVMSYDSVFSRGTVDMSGSPSRVADANGAQTDGDFAKWRLGGSILQPMSGMTSLFAGLSLQRANKYLDSSERFYLGGPYGVRAYGWGEGVGSEGEMLKLEVRQKLDAQTTLTGFYDWGQVRSIHAANNMDASQVDSVMLKGYGLSLGYEIDRQTTLKGTWARRQGSGPDPMDGPLNSDGQYDRNRFWLTMETRF